MQYQRRTNNMTKSILLVGVGGQGTILASKLLTIGLMEQGYDVKMSEIHGMSQRGGSVSSQIRYGEEVFSPVIEKGAADLLVAFEKMEALRWLEYLMPGGKVVVNDHEINPMPVIMGTQEYSENILDEISKAAPTKVINATEEADKLGNGKVCLLYTSDAADEEDSVDLGGRRIIKKKKNDARDWAWKARSISKSVSLSGRHQ